MVDEEDVAGTPEAAGDMIFAIVLAVDWGMLLSIVIAELTVIRLAVLKSPLGLLLPPPLPHPLSNKVIKTTAIDEASLAIVWSPVLLLPLFVQTDDVLQF